MIGKICFDFDMTRVDSLDGCIGLTTANILIILAIIVIIVITTVSTICLDSSGP